MNTQIDLFVSDIMTTNVVTTHKNDMLYDAIRTLETEALSALPVVDSSGKLCGILSNSDLIQLTYNWQCDVSALSAVTDGLRKTLTDILADENRNTKVSQAMSSQVETISPNATVVEAAQMLLYKGVHHLPVTDPTGIPLGIISTVDIVRSVAFFNLGEKESQQHPQPR